MVASMDRAVHFVAGLEDNTVIPYWFKSTTGRLRPNINIIKKHGLLKKLLPSNIALSFSQLFSRCASASAYLLDYFSLSVFIKSKVSINTITYLFFSATLSANSSLSMPSGIKKIMGGMRKQAYAKYTLVNASTTPSTYAAVPINILVRARLETKYTSRVRFLSSS